MYPILKVLPTGRQTINTFRGYNHNHNTADGEAYEMQNMTSDHYPLAASREPRGKEGFWPDCGGILMKERLWRVIGSALTDGERTVDLGLTPASPERPKRLVSMGAFIIVLPDKKYLNTADLTDCGNIETSFIGIGTQARVFPCVTNGDEISREYICPEEPQDPTDGSIWVNTAEYPNKLYRWSEVSQVWTQLKTGTIRITAVGIGEHFSEGDGVVLGGFGKEMNNVDQETQKPLTEEQIEQLKKLDGSNVILARDKDYIVVNGIIDAKVSLTSIVTVKREMPVMDFVVEHKNRLWGCRYGLDAGGEFVNILYASKLGDFKNWTCYQGVETDSYYAHVGSDGPFTGAISYGESVVFAKENGLHLVYGDGPGSFQTQVVSGPGVQNGSGGSMAIVSGVVYYKGIQSVYAFDGSLPVSVGYCLGNVPYTDAVAGSHGGKYVISMLDSRKQPHLFRYDTERRLWHREDALRVTAFAAGSGVLYMLGTDGTVHTSGAGGRESIMWSWQTGIQGTETPDRKRLMRLSVRARMEVGGRMNIHVRYDSMGGWRKIGTVVSRTLRAAEYPVKVRECDHLELKLEGTGAAQIYSITKVYEEVST